MASGMRRGVSFIHVDVMRAYFYANAVCDIYIRLAAKDQESNEYGMCGKLSKAMYGARVVAQNWQRKCSETVQEPGLPTGKVSPCHFFHSKRAVLGIAHATTSSS